MDLNYRSYQQVLNIAVKPTTTSTSNVLNIKKLNSTKKITKPKIKKDESQIKRRTKTGCFTCRKRKKKCDEDKVNGKCQACTRNFLQCCWPEPTPTKEGPKELSAETRKCSDNVSTVRSTKCDINSLLASPITTITPPVIKKQELPSTKQQESHEKQKISEKQNPYPSPIQSPVSLYSHPNSPNNEISYISLPPLYNFNYKLHAKDSNVRGSKNENDDNTKIQSKSNEQTIPQPNKVVSEESRTRFIITSFNSRKDLCEIN
ncbi:uncharacterized protein KGF55_003265 [Candida pseudojiufengensis]|uniref:uncharacterized protein n=1 Tax=Candida pseudojiufengensis TaxID=497109 RepID=UPI002224932E|nr:uncharacterized protein KGF55_003265 [Candida pseudojiufengensis]KAI5962189.1 hypothetical protein KGF55_003265 [Candida pseudojiufengensis]